MMEQTTVDQTLRPVKSASAPSQIQTRPM